jgi:hypothetical protein
VLNYVAESGELRGFENRSTLLPGGGVRGSGFQFRLAKAGTPEAFQIVFPLGVLSDRDFFRDPVERDIGLHASKLLQSRLRHIVLPSHACRRGQHAVSTYEIGTLPNAFSSEPHRLLIVAAYKLRVRRDTVVDRGQWITWAQAQCALH